MQPIVEFEILEENRMVGIAPKRGTAQSSGIDVFVPYGFNNHVEDVAKNSDIIIPLNIRLKIPEGYDIEVKNKSGIATKLRLFKGAELIDVDYRGNVRIHLFNFNDHLIEIKDGMKIAQLVLRPVVISDWKQVENIDLDTERGEGWRGSTGDRIDE